MTTQAAAQTNQTETWINWTDPKTGLVYEILPTGEYCIDMNNDTICDVTFIDGKMVFDERSNQTETNQTQPIPEPTIITQTEETNLIWECTAPDPKTQCFTKTLDNGTIWVGNGKPIQTPITTNNEQGYQGTYDVETDETDEEPEAGPPVTQTSSSGSGNGGSSDRDRAGASYGGHHCDEKGVCIDPSVPKCGEGVDEVCYTDDGDLRNFPDYPDCNDDGTNEPCIADDGEVNTEEEDQNCGGESCTDTEKEDSTTDEDDSLYG